MTPIRTVSRYGRAMPERLSSLVPTTIGLELLLFLCQPPGFGVQLIVLVGLALLLLYGRARRRSGP